MQLHVHVNRMQVSECVCVREGGGGGGARARVCVLYFVSLNINYIYSFSPPDVTQLTVCSQQDVKNPLTNDLIMLSSHSLHVYLFAPSLHVTRPCPRGCAINCDGMHAAERSALKPRPCLCFH